MKPTYLADEADLVSIFQVTASLAGGLSASRHWFAHDKFESV
jgi:hypothetical protein